MEDCEGKVDPLNSEIAVTLTGFTAVEGHIVESKVFEFLYSPRCEHDPREDRVDK